MNKFPTTYPIVLSRYSSPNWWISWVSFVLPMHFRQLSHRLRRPFDVHILSICVRIRFSLWWCTAKWPLYRTDTRLCWKWPIKQLNAFEKIGQSRRFSKIHLRDDRIPTRLQCQWTTIETLDRILSDALLIGAVAWLGGITLLLVIRINCTSRTISSVACHLWSRLSQTLRRKYFCWNWGK